MDQLPHVACPNCDTVNRVQRAKFAAGGRCGAEPGRELREAVELWLAWRRVASEVAEGLLGTEYNRADRAEVQAEVKAAGLQRHQRLAARQPATELPERDIDAPRRPRSR